MKNTQMQNNLKLYTVYKESVLRFLDFIGKLVG